MTNHTNIYDIPVKTIEGRETTMAEFQNQVLLIVNVASECGFTPQYEGLEAVYQKYKDKGLNVLGFPCNQFGGQEPGNDEQIKGFCQARFGVTFPLFSKISVNGPETHPLYSYLKGEKKGVLGTEGIKWNFTKFLVNRQGQVVKRFAPTVTPRDLEKEVEKIL